MGAGEGDETFSRQKPACPVCGADLIFRRVPCPEGHIHPMLICLCGFDAEILEFK